MFIMKLTNSSILKQHVLRMKHLLLFTIFVFSTSFADPEKPSKVYPQGYFQSPVAHSIKLSGTFGELRPQHFHSGIDISPAPKQRFEPLFAAAEGYVSRISIQAGGYGQALYVTHPNGYTTLYGHMEKFITRIDTFVKRVQYQNERFEQDILLQPNEIPINQGQQIGNMGNRGHSFGQHVHFEIRETATGNPINPLLFGFGVADHEPPSIRSMKVYFLNTQKEVIDTKIVSLVKKGSSYGISGDTLATPSVFVGFSLKTYDKQDDDSGDNGIFSLTLRENDQPIYNFKTESFAFDQTRYINAHIDYNEQRRSGGYYHRTFKLAGNQLNMYENIVNNGLITLDNTTKKVNIRVTDAAGNASNVDFYIKSQGDITPAVRKPYTYLLPYNEPSLVQVGGAKFVFQNGAFYENAYVNFATTTEGGTYGTYSPIYSLMDESPMHRSMTIAIQPLNLPDTLKSKAFIAFCPRQDSRVYNCGGKWNAEGFLETRNTNFGRYCIMADITPPTISPVSFQTNMRTREKMSFKIKDNYETEGSAAGLTYRATVDDKWILMEFDSKNDLLFHQFDGTISAGQHALRLVVTDNRGNSRTFESIFIL
jgi:Peptidase family M23